MINKTFGFHDGNILDLFNHNVISILEDQSDRIKSFQVIKSTSIVLSGDIQLNEIFNKLQNPSIKLYLFDEKDIIWGFSDDHVLTINYSKLSMNYKSLYITIYSRDTNQYEKVLQEIRAIFKKNLATDIPCLIDFRWYYFSKGETDYRPTSDMIDDILFKEAYPYIEDLKEYIDRYIDGDEQVILLIGAPGTGKTRLIRYIIKMIQLRKEKKILSLDYFDEPRSEVFYTNDESVLLSDRIFMDFFCAENCVMVLEDIDYDLRSREDRNPFMYKLLASSDGVIKSKNNNKIILSTNLSSIDDIDEALLRPGRCYDILQMRSLTRDESYKFLSNLIDVKTTKIELENKDYTLAELYGIVKDRTNANRTLKEKNKLGFK